ncbi:hypothetical protein J8L86_08000 [Shewanella sp. MMG014]|uniref:hypothetical protein n=1 Tax=Shewanella sp. MMG014 TaxID=2822691 RepID=UPI001B38B101|nr:hypothetical protein [Shewanella sp. MMG014]MBQ4889785.1 hypothetical protein [Shewanella sp. MMG014]
MKIDIVSYSSIMGVTLGMSPHEVEQMLGKPMDKDVNPSNHLVHKYLLSSNRLIVVCFDKIEIGSVINVLVDVFDSDGFTINGGELIQCASLENHLYQLDKKNYTCDSEILFLELGIILGEFSYKDNEYPKFVSIFNIGSQNHLIDKGIFKPFERSSDL